MRIRGWLLAMMAFVLSLPAGAALAVEMDVKGEFRYSFLYVDNGNFYDHSWDQQSEDGFHVRQRIRIQTDFVASEQLQGVLALEIGEIQWGRGGSVGKGSGGQLGADGVNVETKRAYIEFFVPNTDLIFRVGIQGLANPEIGLGYALFYDDVAGITASYRFTDMVSATAYWVRPYDSDSNSITSPSSPDFDEFDVFGFWLPIKGDGWKVTPYAAFTSIGRDVFRREDALGVFPFLLSPAHAAGLKYRRTPFTNEFLNDQNHVYGWWTGSTFEVTMFDPLSIGVEALYGSVEAENDALDRRGFYAAAEMDYKLSMVTLSLAGWYATGEDSSWRNGSEQLPSIRLDDGFGITSFGFDGSEIIPGDPVFSFTPAGKWGLRAALKDFSFIEDLSHTLRFLYARGTNHPDSRRIVGLTSPNLILGYKATPAVVPAGFFTQAGIFPGTIIPGIDLTTQDCMIEVNFDHEYKIYENLGLLLELGMVHIMYGNDVWVHDDTSTAWKAGMQLKYKF